MPAKVTEPATGYEEIDRWPGGVGWIAHPDELMQRASHALATDEGVLVIEPVDAPGIDDLIAAFGSARAVVVLSNHHLRDADAVARRHDVPVVLPTRMTGLTERLDAPVERLDAGESLGGYELLEVAHSDSEFWQEFALFDGETLVCSESISGAPYNCVGDERLGVMTMRRLTPPERLRGLDPERVLCGHGPGLEEGAAAEVDRAIDTARRSFPRALLANGLSQIRTVTAALRS